jgi:hypothetical protein
MYVLRVVMEDAELHALVLVKAVVILVLMVVKTLVILPVIRVVTTDVGRLALEQHIID